MKYMVLGFVVIFSGCANWFPASVKNLEDGTYRIRATGNSFVSAVDLKDKLDKKANSLCGDIGFEYIHKPSVEWHKQKDYSTGVTSSYQVMTTTVKCGKSI